MERPKKNPQRVRTPYTKEFKLEAVRLLQLGQKPAATFASPHKSGLFLFPVGGPLPRRIRRPMPGSPGGRLPTKLQCSTGVQAGTMRQSPSSASAGGQAPVRGMSRRSASASRHAGGVKGSPQ